MKIMARPITKGGVIIGSREKAFISFPILNLDLSTIRANAKPIAVARNPTDVAIRILFLSILNVEGYATSVVTKLPGFIAPSTTILLAIITRRGKIIKITRSDEIPRIEPEINKSP